MNQQHVEKVQSRSTSNRAKHQGHQVKSTTNKDQSHPNPVATSNFVPRVLAHTRQVNTLLISVRRAKINFTIENSKEQILANEAPIRMQENARGSVLSRAALIQYASFTF